MRRLMITQTDYGQWIAETSGGVRGVGSTLESAVEKIIPSSASRHEGDTEELMLLEAVFSGIPNIVTGQIAHGQASG